MLIETRRVDRDAGDTETAAARASESERRQFAEIAARNEEPRQRTHDFDAFARLDAEFNRLCIAACRNELASSMMQVIHRSSPLLVHPSRPDTVEGRRGSPHRDRAALSRGNVKAGAVPEPSGCFALSKPHRSDASVTA